MATRPRRPRPPPARDDRRIRTQPGVLARLRSFALTRRRANGLADVADVSEALSANALSLDRLLADVVTRSDLNSPLPRLRP